MNALPRSGLRPHPPSGAEARGSEPTRVGLDGTRGDRVSRPRGLQGTLADWQSQIRGGCLIGAVAVSALLAPALAQAQLFPDNEARKAILELRANDEQLKKDLAAQNRELSDQLQTIKRSLLELNSQIEQLRAEMARQRGTNEQLARDVAELQRRQKDIAQGIDERIRKVEPQRVTLDGRDFLADPEEKRLFDEAMAIVRASDFPGAVSALTNFLRRYPESGYAHAARFWLGNAHYGKRELRESITIFRTFIANAPEGHPRVPEALLAIANAQSESRDRNGARATLNELLRRFPESEAAQAGKDRLAELK